MEEKENGNLNKLYNRLLSKDVLFLKILENINK